MGCQDEPVALDNEVTAARAAQLARVAEQAAADSGLAPPRYVIGTEVPVPGGALEEIAELDVTRPEASLETLRVHRDAFRALGLESAFARVIAIVVQPGVEFGHVNVSVYRPDRARTLSDSLAQMPGLVFEAHSTDYQPAAALVHLVEDGFSILKVGPGLTFALREALYGLDAIASELQPGYGRERAGLRQSMEALLLAEPQHWQPYYRGDEADQRIQRHYSYSDRIRYYWTHPHACAAVERLFDLLHTAEIPETLISQYLAPVYPQVLAGLVPPLPRELCLGAVRRALTPYTQATCRAA